MPDLPDFEERHPHKQILRMLKRGDAPIEAVLRGVWKITPLEAMEALNELAQAGVVEVTKDQDGKVRVRARH